MIKHTPGPWKHNETYGLIVARDGSEIAACHAGSTGSKAETLANARLIAAAPDLLDKLKDLTSAVARIPADQKSMGWQELVQRAFEVIAKAEVAP